MIGTNSFLEDFGYRNNQIMLLNGALYVVDANTTFLNKS